MLSTSSSTRTRSSSSLGRTLKIGLDASDVREALYVHHPAYQGAMGMQWVCLTEWMDIDFLAIECWQQARVVGYEVKVSRGDMRSELLNPTKRAEAVSRTTEFYFAVPAGMLTSAELDFEQPEDWTFEDFERGTCTNPECHLRRAQRGFRSRAPKPRGSTLRGTSAEGVSINYGYGRDQGTHEDGSTYSHGYSKTACCVVCRGYGRVGKTRVELEAPVLWIPPDVGLVEVDGRRVTVVKRAPKRKAPRLLTGVDEPDEGKNRVARHSLSQLVRWSSHYGDPRHRNAR